MGILGVSYAWSPLCFAMLSFLIYFKFRPNIYVSDENRFTKLSGIFYGGLQ